ncbi:pyruvate dehydrogenase complex dihydrolipoyllysine-residue acetyltransferase [Halomonas sp. McH1-25]|uniref:pyruvate dehydrogenase complex dihydrolipoyllysine-residue acetyltransferase n=1 Tax=unclassified Halomonas TaxID=2609666 RepID=UPI001EF6D068|nr:MULTISPECIES: pyruvate dehydrogenase complex dihydrolipoyllysine-residue acetyltransferase [unclassified Halomonas]MCG7600728.1 pyruvate dehydrogenase complex dihydrolipoyllysine-residue acetyltransferase [Halomonas sp. McH1-25]MCP1341306.1 pyruvate dehydrogenase complex dihydrolipoyllysine-residue acetyltransferase [Halomonas sp. FL8]MCP1362402.1 pyruvate dehydrogenase complex dihydrolipoyllysine-residue acetyltransferase [Halomonas sp. BBD45]
MSSEIIKVPDIGGSTDVEIIEIAVSEGDVIAPEDTMITLESDKASMDVPAPKGGKVVKILVKEGDTVSEGDDILELEAEGEDGGEAEQESEQESAAAAEDTPEEKPAKQASGEQAKPARKSGGGKRTVEIKVPDIGGSENVEIIEVAVAEGDEVNAEDALITLESDKASMDVPSPHSGKIVSLAVKEGDSVSEGDVIGTMEIAGEGGGDEGEPEEAASRDEAVSETAEVDEPQEGEVEETEGESQRKEIRVPDIGGSENVPIIEVAVSEGDEINEEDPLITLESDKASMDVPSPFKGKLVELSVKEGDTVSEGDLIGYMEVAGAKKPKPKQAETPRREAAAERKPAGKSQQVAEVEATAKPSPEAQMASQQPRKGKLAHAGPAVRMLARELGVELSEVTPSGPKGRVLKEDVHAYVKQVLKQRKDAPAAGAASATAGGGIPPIPAIDFSQFGEVEEQPMGRLLKAGATNLHRSWLNVPHVTQFDEADITELEAFRKSMKAEAEAEGAKLTPLPFLVKACAFALRKYPQFNVSLHPDGDKLVWKKYVHIGVAVDTPDGLMVPVIRDADKKSLYELARESVDLAKRAQAKKLKREEMQGGCFTISSLGSIGGTAFTPIVNAPEVAILGVSKAQMKPVWDGKDFAPRLMMPLSLSYDHRAVNGADAARFTAFLAQVLSDIRRLLL